jgi:hypothetical protein
MLNQINDWQNAVEDVSKGTANFETVSDYIQEKTGMAKDLSETVNFLVETWRNASTIEQKDVLCRNEIVSQHTTTTTLSIIRKLFFEHLVITIQEVFMSERYDPTGRQEDISIVDDICLVIGIEPKI